MAIDTSKVVDVVITKETARNMGAGFDKPLIFGTIPVTATGFTGVVKEYFTLQGLIDDGFVPTDEIYKVAELGLAQDVTPSSFFVGKQDTNVADSIEAVYNANSSWYAIVGVSKADEDILAIAEFIEAKDKMYFAVTADADVLGSGTTDIASLLRAEGYGNTALYYHASDYLNAGVLFGQIAKPMGSVTYKFKTVNGVSASGLSDNDIAVLDSKNVNYFDAMANEKLTLGNGVVVGGEYIDVIQGIHWLESNIAREVFDGLASVDKVPYNQNGINFVGSKIRNVLIVANTTQAFITDDYVVSVPKIEEVPKIDKEERILRNCSFTATLTGAIQKTKIKGTVVA